MGEAPGQRELEAGRPFAGPSGWELDKILESVGMARTACRVTNVTGYAPREVVLVGKERDDIGVWFGGKYPDRVGAKRCAPQIIEGLADLHAEIAACQPEMILALGSTALWALTGECGNPDAPGAPTGIASWRGSMLYLEPNAPFSLGRTPLPRVRVCPSWHPAAMLRKWELRADLVHDVKRAVRGLAQPDWPPAIERIQISPSAGDVCDILADLVAHPRPVANDIETTARQISVVGLAWTPHDALVIPLMTKRTADHSFYSRAEEQRIIDLLRKVLEGPGGVVGQNYHYDAQYKLRQWGILPNCIGDTSWMQHILFPGQPKKLEYLSSLYCRHHVYWKDELDDYHKLPEDEETFWRYNGRDCIKTFEIWETLGPVIERAGLAEPYAFQMRLWRPVLDMMIRGVRIDVQQRQALLAEVKRRKRDLAHWLEAVVGTTVGFTDEKKAAAATPWYRSPAQTCKLLYDEMKLPEVRDRKTGSRSAGAEALAKLGKRGGALSVLCDRLADYGSLDTYASDTKRGTSGFLYAPADGDGRMRCSFNVAGTETFRFSSSGNAWGNGMNLQNMPRDTDINVRGMFAPDPGMVLLDWDLSSADLRVMVKESGASYLAGLLAAGKDVYTETAKEYYGDSSISKSDPRRQTFKSVAHAFDNVAGSRTVALSLDLELRTVERIRASWFSRNPELPRWHESVQREINTRRMVTNPFGYRRVFFGRLDQCLSEGVNWKQQSVVGITINHGLVAVFEQLPWVDLLLQVHDSLVMQIPRARFTPEDLRAIRDRLTIAIPYRPDPLTIPVGVKWSDRSWGECAALPFSL